METTENSISSILDFKIFWGSSCPKKPLEASAFGARSIHPLLRNIRISTNTPTQTPPTRLSSNFALHLIKVGKLKRFKKVSSDLKTILKTDLADLPLLAVS